MKRRFTFLLTAVFLLMSGLTWGQTRTEVVAYTLDGTETGGTSGYATESEITQEGLTWMVTGNTNMNPWRIGGKSLSEVDRPLYSTGTISDNITKVVVTNGTAANVTVNSMTLIVSSNADFSNPTSTLEGEFAASSTTTFNRPAATDWSNKYFKLVYNLTITATSNKFVQFVSAEFYKEEGGQQSVATPTFDPAGGTYTTTQNVAINCTTQGATIYYTTDGTTPTTSSSVYSSPIAISETTTVKAMAAKAGMSNSNVATAVYNFPVVYANIAAWKADHTATNSTVSSISGDLTAVFQNANSLYVQDVTGGLLIYGNLGTTYNNGDIISGGISGTSTLYNGTIEFIPTSTFPEGIAGTAVQPTVVTAAAIAENYDTYAGRLVKIEGITFNADHTFNTSNSAGRTTTFTQNGTTLTCFDSFKVLGGFEVTEGENADIIGLVGCYNTTKQIFPRSTEDIIPQTTPIYYNVNIAQGIQNGTIQVDPTSATEGTTIMVTATPANNNYMLESLTYSYPGALPIDIMETQQFAMPAADVTVSGTFALKPTVATPTFTPEAGEYSEAQNVTISCGTEGATIHYTVDGTTPTANSATYSAPIAISETTTVKAIAMKDGMLDSEVATATYTIVIGPSLITIAEARALANNEYALVQGVVTFIDGRNVYVQDETAGIDLYLNSNTVPGTLALGDMVLAYGKKTVYNGLVELTAINGSASDQFSIVSNGNALPVSVKTISEILADNNGDKMLQSTRVQIVEATIGAINTSSNTTITQNGSSAVIYKIPAVEGLVEGDLVTVTCVISRYNNNMQLRIAVAADVTYQHPQVETVATPTFTPAEGTYTEAQNVTISCATDDATIHYTVDGSTPTANSATYSAPIAISETTTVKAIAMKDGMLDSEVATATYTINVTPPAQETAYTLITHANALISGDKYIIVGIKGENYKALGKQANNNRIAVDVTPVENVVTLTPATTNDGGVFELTLGQADGKWTLYDAVNEGYLYAASSSSNYLKVQAENDANGQWTIEIADNGVATIKAQGTNTRNWLRLNNNGTPFACYASGQLDVYLYKAGDVPTPPTPTYYNVTVASGITNGTVSVDPTSALEGATITVTAEAVSGYELTALTYTYAGVATPIDILEAMQFVMPAADVTVNATFIELAHVANPTFTPAAGSYIIAQQVSIATATEDATIYYTTDGTEPTANSSVYAAPFTVSATTTVKAMAVKEGMNNSDVVTATYTIIEPMTIAAAKGLAINEYALVQGVVTFIDVRNVYVQDATSGIDLYLNNNTVPSTLAAGDLVLAYGKKAVYNGLIELSGINGNDANQFFVLSSGNGLPVAEKTIAEIVADYQTGANLLQSTRVQIVEAVIGAINNSGNTPITQDGNSMNIYKMPVVEGLLENDIVTVTGVIGCYNAPQLRVASADDVTFEHPIYPTLIANPTAVSGFNYTYGQGPSQQKTFALSASNLEGAAYVYPSENFEVSMASSAYFVPENPIVINSFGNFNNLTINVRLKTGLEIGTYEETLYACSVNADTIYITVNGSVTEPQQASDYTRLTDLSQLNNGAKVIFAARFNEDVNEYYAMTAQASGKPTGVLFTSVAETIETLPSTIADADSVYYWTVATDGTNYTFTNAAGDVLGYTSSTNFATGGDNINWTIVPGTSEAGAMVPEYSAFVVTNANVTNRAFALNSNHNFGPYHTQNMSSANYNFFLDMFYIAGTGAMVCATPTFTPAAGTYYEAQEVTINCATADATVYYTLDGSDPTVNSTVYTEPIAVNENVTIKAIAMKEGFEDSEIAEAQYILILDAVTIFNQDWEGDMNGWTFVTVEGNKPWIIGQYSGNHYAYGNGYNGGVNEQWCISPAFSLEQYSDVTLTFVNAKNYTGPDLELFFSNDYDGTDPTTATWTELTFEMSTGSFAWVESGVIEFTGFTGDECYIGFKYTSTETEAAAWEVDDIMLMGFTSDPVLTVTPLSLTGFSYFEGNGPSNEQTFMVTGFNLTGNVIITIAGEEFEMSSTTGEDFDPIEEYEIEPYEGAIDEVIYVRMTEGLDAGAYTTAITVASELDDITVTLSGTVNEPIQGGDWNRIGSLADLNNGAQVVIASRYDATVGDGYYAMTAEVSGKPDGVLFTSVNSNGIETLPDEIVADITTFMWNVTVNDTIITLTNADGDMLGYSSSTNFAGNTNTDWSIIFGTSGENAMVPNYSGFVITNGTTTNRGIAKNTSNKFGAYSTSNINNADYNFYLDLFVLGGTATQTVATPVFSVASGTYYEAFDVEITCATEGATIYYTNDGTEPTTGSMVYEGAIHVDADMTLKAIAMLEGYENSGIATVNYVVITSQTVILDQDWEGEMNGWTFVTVEGNKPWTVSSYGGNHYAYANGYNDDSDNEQWCISPSFDLTFFTDVVLTFRNAKNYNGPDLELYFADDYDGQDPTAASWQPLEFTMSTGSYTWTESGEISLDGFHGESCNIAFRYISTIDDGAAAWEVDDILLLGTDYDVVEETEVMDVNLWNYDDEIFVENNTNSNVQLMVFNLLGQPVLTQTICSGSSRFSHNLAQGMYVVTLQNNKGRMAVKMIVR